MNAAASHKITRLQFLCALGVIGLHTVFTKHFDAVPLWAVELNAVFRILFDAATSLFFFLSAALFYRKADEKRYGRVLLQKVRTLAIPYLLWSALGLVHEVIRARLTVGFWPPYSAGDVFTLLVLRPENHVLWFLQVLFCYFLIYPLLRWAVRKKWPALALAGLAAAISLWPEARVVYASPIFWLPCYLLGAYVGYHHDDWFTRVPSISKKPRYAAAAFLFAGLTALGLTGDAGRYAYWQLTPILLWPLADGLGRGPAPRWWVGETFYLFCAHLIFVPYALKLYRLALGAGTAAMVAANVLLPCLCAALAMVCAAPVRALLPRVFAVLTGGRGVRTPEKQGAAI